MLPIILLSIFGIVNLFIGFADNKRLLLPAALLFIATALASTLLPDANAFNNTLAIGNIPMLSSSPNATVFTMVLLISAMLVLPFSSGFASRLHGQPAEYFSILMFSLVGAIMMVAFENLLMLFVGLEILSISMYIMTGANKRDLKGNEAALKYFLMGAFATGILLFGVALLYGATHSFTLQGINAYVSNPDTDVVYHLGLLLLLVGMLFKLSAVPFHFWTPDVYDGAPTMVTAFMSTIVKTAGFAALYRVLSSAFGLVPNLWLDTMLVITVLTLVVGNLSAVVQHSFKRMLAFSSISHAGYLLIAVCAFNGGSLSAIIFYSFAYAIATIMAFGLLILVSEQRQTNNYDGFNGLARTNPLLAIAMVVSMASLAGIPLTAGFFGKLMVFISAAEAGLTWLLVVAVLVSAVGVYYYFRVAVAMYSKKATNQQETVQYAPLIVSPVIGAALVIGTILTLMLGIFPNFFLQLVN